jgi:hypothetical protein
MQGLGLGRKEGGRMRERKKSKERELWNLKESQSL